MNGKLIHFISQWKRFGKGCKHHRAENKGIWRLAIWIEFLNVPTIYHSRERRIDSIPFWEHCSIHAACPHSNAQQVIKRHAKRPVGHTFTCDEWRRRRRQCRRRAEQKPRIKIHGIIKFTVRPTSIWSTRKKSGRRRPLVLGQFTRQPTKTEGRKKRRKKKRNYPSSTRLWEL